jgi:hypothetical protein
MPRSQQHNMRKAIACLSRCSSAPAVGAHPHAQICADVIARLEAVLGGKLDAPHELHVVRHVAPEKYHVCLSFTVPAAVAFCGREHPSSHPSSHPGGHPGSHPSSHPSSHEAQTGVAGPEAKASCSQGQASAQQASHAEDRHGRAAVDALAMAGVQQSHSDAAALPAAQLRRSGSSARTVTDQDGSMADGATGLRIAAHGGDDRVSTSDPVCRIDDAGASKRHAAHSDACADTAVDRPISVNAPTSAAAAAVTYRQPSKKVCR